MYRSVLALVAATLLTTTSAFACDGQKGDVVFEDAFADDTGGWTFDDYFISSPPGAFVLVPANDNGSNITVLNKTFTAGQADYCSEMGFPKGAADLKAAIGLVVFAQDGHTYMVLTADIDGTVSLYKLTNKNWTTLFTAKTNDVVKVEENAVNALRIVIKDGLLTAIVNDQKIKSIRLQVPNDNLMFGVFGEYDSGSAAPVEFLVHSFKVTEGE